jgi:hypothetical protein
VHRLLAEQLQHRRTDITTWCPATARPTPRPATLATAETALAAETAFTALFPLTAEAAFAAGATLAAEAGLSTLAAEAAFASLTASAVHRHSFARPRSTAAGVTMAASAASGFVWGVHNILQDIVDDTNDISLPSLTQPSSENFPLPQGQGVDWPACATPTTS